MSSDLKSDLSGTVSGDAHLRALDASEDCVTPTSISATSSSSEDEATLLPLDSYDVIKRAQNPIDNPRSKDVLQIPKIDPTAILEIEEQAKIAARSLGEMTTFLSEELHEMSSVSAQSIELYSEAVRKAASSVESNIRVMYGLMAKCEELNRKMKPVQNIQTQVQDILKQLEELESACNM